MKQILVRAPQWLGDAVVSTVFISRLKARYPNASVSVLAPASLTALFSAHPDVKDVLAVFKGESPWSVGARVRNQGFDTVIILPRSFRTALEAWWSRIPTRLGYSGDWRSWLLTRALPYDSHRRYAHRYLRLIDEENFPLDDVRPFFPTQEPGPDKKSIVDFFKNCPRPFLGMGPASIAPARTWDVERFGQIAKRFVEERGGSVVLFGTSKEKAITAAIQSRVPRQSLDTAGQLDLSELGWAVQQCDTMLVNDSGLMHVASCFQKPTVVLFGASDPQWALPPWGRFQAIQHTEVACVPCLQNTCVRFGEARYECLKAITVGEVWNAIAK